MVLDSSARVAPYRILLQTADSQIFWNVACGESPRPDWVRVKPGWRLTRWGGPRLVGSSRKEITEHWDWLEANLLQTVAAFDNDSDVATFVRGKISVRRRRSLQPNMAALCLTCINCDRRV